MKSEDERMRTVAGVKVSRIGFSSHDEKTQIKGLLWMPESMGTHPRAIIQISHGMEEHIGRYIDFANHLAAQGYVVCAADMLGHGLSVVDESKRSCMPAENGVEILLEDVHELRKMVASRFAQQTPYFMLGHSFGSYLVRVYMAQCGEGLAGVILCGAGQLSKLLSLGGNMLAKALVRFKGEDYRSDFLESMGMGAYAKSVENSQTKSDWHCTDPEVIEAFISDPLCGVPFSAGAYVTTTSLTKMVSTGSHAASVPKDLPILFISGTNDPVGDNGKGVKCAADLLTTAGVKQVDVVMYEGLRHEILNEPQKQEVYTDVTAWIEGVLHGKEV